MSLQSIASTPAYPLYRRNNADSVQAGRTTVSEPEARTVAPRKNVPVERVIEGELLERDVSVSRSSDDVMNRFLLLRKSSYQGEELQPPTAIAAYLNNRRLDDAAIQSSLDLYV